MKPTYLDCLALLGVGGAHPGGLKLTKDILLQEDMDTTKRVLDVGCGTGQTLAFIANQYQCAVTALDSSDVMVEKAKERFSDLTATIDFVHGNVEKLPFEYPLFDIILSESVLAFTDISMSIPEVKRILKPSGVLLAIEMVRERAMPNEVSTEIQDFYGIAHLLSENEWVAFFKENGFEQISVEKVDLQYEPHDMDSAAEFSLSENIPEECFYVLKQHQHLSNEYGDYLGFRIFRCSIKRGG